MNGSMSDGGALPTPWKADRGAVIARDTVVVRKGPAALRAEIQAGQSVDVAEQHVNGAAYAGKRVRYSGSIKGEGAVQFQFPIQPYATNWTRERFHTLKYAEGDTDWIDFAGEMAIEEWATGGFLAVLYLEGQGRAWLDEVGVRLVEP